MRASFTDIIAILQAVRDTARKPHDNAGLDFLTACMTGAMRSRAQFFQDLWVLFELGERRDGYFVEFGAADGVHCSNSWLFENELGWRGILAEPARGWHAALHRNRRCHIDTRCVWSRTGETLMFNEPVMTLHATIDAFSDHDGLAATRVDGQRYEVETVSLNDLLTHWQAPARIDYLSLDTEGSELAILEAFDFDRWDVRCISVEHNNTPQRAQLRDLLAGKGYINRFPALSNVDDWYIKPGT
ncbi:MAG TPA: FkbM family methyltransferase [Brevundimonas sp.]|jgi:FkbM family methyltransferase|uniref:FkbM family methyltransferase n=1 Tax=Brevundimonas sp. TaxID=1871086 RepID=UPI002E11976B|nr:FkbM family methyltransferase [Brevundimonas sp.]